ncbi:SMP-30/gluconolactonase/LRE family protein [Mucilaginibacter puniceus]
MLTPFKPLNTVIALLIAGVASSCAQIDKSLIKVEAADPAFNKLVSNDAKADVIATGIMWSEGPVWVESQKMLLFSEVRNNTVYKWTEAKGKEVYLKPSGYTGTIPRGGEMGSNGLGLNLNGQLVLCQDGDRVVSIMDAPLDKPQAKYIPIASNYNGKKFDSPNDLAFMSNGDIYFTDPFYGLEKGVTDPLKEEKYQGVYRISNGKVTLLTTEITNPNGIGIFPGEKKIIIANSNPENPVWYTYDLDKNGLFTNKKIFFTAKVEAKGPLGSPDGLKIDKAGNVWATGPEGVWVLNKDGKLLGRIVIDDLASNLSFSADEKTIYVTNNSRVLRIKLR